MCTVCKMLLGASVTSVFLTEQMDKVFCGTVKQIKKQKLFNIWNTMGIMKWLAFRICPYRVS